ncbi:hypothetical protein ABZ412_24370 [Nocardia sp. NPDC005746]|uniref:hypothetical protein n=1 Tax=unclassified Nocardia TaxID=2637762 RepID=UPI003404964B
MAQPAYDIGEGPATRMSLSLPEGTAEAIRRRVGTREFSAFVTSAVERELRGLRLDEYPEDYERRRGALSETDRRHAFDRFEQALTGGDTWPDES